MKQRKPMIIITETSIINLLLMILQASLQVSKNILADTYQIFLILVAAKKRQMDQKCLTKVAKVATVATVAKAIAEIKIEILRGIIIIIELSMIKY